MDRGAERDRWARLQELFEEALDLPARERPTYLERIRDSDLRRELAGLLSGHEGEGRLDGISSALATLTDGGPRPGKDEEVPETVGPYRVERVLGRGGMGAVYLARRGGEPSADPVALKVLRRAANNERVRRRFLVEREILGRLDHPGIARPLDSGLTDDGAPYMAMEFVDGVAIDVYCDEGRLRIRDRLALFASVCDAVSYAHELGVVHRDLKPDNILATRSGEVRLLDFGIAKILDGGSLAAVGRRTTTGVTLLTLDYASPEQLLERPITPASDVYQLGLLLYRLLTARIPAPHERIAGHAPGGSTTGSPLAPSRIVRCTGRATFGRDTATPFQVAAARGTGIEELSRLLRGDLDTIAVTALREDPEERYASAAELARDVRLHLEGAPVVGVEPARRPKKAYVGRHRLVVGVALAVALAAAALVRLFMG